MNTEGTTQRIERRFNKRGTKKNKIKKIKKFNDNKFNKSKHISNNFNNLDDDSFDNNEYFVNQSIYDYDIDSINSEYFSYCDETIIYCQYGYFRSNIISNYFKINCFEINNIDSKIKIILNKWNIDIANKFNKLASYIYYKFRINADYMFSLKDVFIIHLTKYFDENNIKINQSDIRNLLDILFNIAKEDDKYNYIFRNYRNIILFFFSNIIRYNQFSKKKNQYILFNKVIEENKYPIIDSYLQEYIMSFIP
jgi:hypothetical protein